MGHQQVGLPSNLPTSGVTQTRGSSLVRLSSPHHQPTFASSCDGSTDGAERKISFPSSFLLPPCLVLSLRALRKRSKREWYFVRIMSALYLVRSTYDRGLLANNWGLDERQIGFLYMHVIQFTNAQIWLFKDVRTDKSFSLQTFIFFSPLLKYINSLFSLLLIVQYPNWRYIPLLPPISYYWTVPIILDHHS